MREDTLISLYGKSVQMLTPTYTPPQDFLHFIEIECEELAPIWRFSRIRL